jgi:hypothetical protein
MKPDKFELEKLVREYNDAKEFSEKTAKRANELKSTLLEYVKEHGTPDDRGHKWLGAGGSQIKHERRVGKSFDLSAAEDWARDLGIWDQVKQVIEVITEDAVLRYAWENPEHHETVTGFYNERETWAFKIVNQKSYDDQEDE